MTQAKALGMQVTYDTTINGKASDFTAQATALANSGATATWLYMAPTPAANLATTPTASATTRPGSPTRSPGTSTSR